MRRAKEVHSRKNSSRSKKHLATQTQIPPPRVVNNIPPDLPILDEELSIIEAYLNEVIIGITEVQDRKRR